MRGLAPTCSYQNPSADRSSLRRYKLRGCDRARLPETTTRSPGLKVVAMTPMSASSVRLSISRRQRCAVPAKTAHYVHGKEMGPCKFLIVQGVGVYDFLPVG